MWVPTGIVFRKDKYGIYTFNSGPSEYNRWWSFLSLTHATDAFERCIKRHTLRR